MAQKISDYTAKSLDFVDGDLFEVSKFDGLNYATEKYTWLQLKQGLGEPAKRYKANLNQSGTDVPVATEFVNTFNSPITYSRNAVGDYVIQSTAEFTSGKTFIIVGAGTYPCIVEYGYSDSSNLYLATRTNLTGTLSDNKLYETAVLIEVYL